MICCIYKEIPSKRNIAATGHTLCQVLNLSQQAGFLHL